MEGRMGAADSPRRGSKSGFDSQRYERKNSVPSIPHQYLSHNPATPTLPAIPTTITTTNAPRSPNPVSNGAAAAATPVPDQRPKLMARTNSAPLRQKTDRDASTPGLYLDESHYAAAYYNSIHHDGRDDDELAGVVGAVKTFEPFKSSELSDALPEINIAVIGHEGVGKSTFVQRALELATPPHSQAAERAIPLGQSVYLVRLLELAIDDIDIDDDETISWPDTIEDKVMPRVDGALALYDVKDKASVEDLPEMLRAFTKADLPAVLISCKCDTPPTERQIDPAVIEQNAKRTINNISTLQISGSSPEGHRRGIFMLLNEIISNNPEDHARSSSASRRRAQTNAVRPVTPRESRFLGHSRASSEFTGGQQKDQRRNRYDSSLAGHNSRDRLRVPREEDQMRDSFLIEESESEHSPTSSRSSSSRDANLTLTGVESTSSSFSDNGPTFDELVDRLLSQPTSKSDLKFSSIFFALFRNFASPSKLLEAIVKRFENLERNGCPQIVKTQTQLRYLGLIEQWIGSYPGDFAFANTKRRLQSFVSKLSGIRIFAQAAKEITFDLEVVREDDDTYWAFNDRDCEASGDSNASTLVEVPTFTFDQTVGGPATLSDEGVTEHLPKLSNQVLSHLEQAQKQAQLLQPIPRNPITKVQWHALMEQSDDFLAQELTRMDWIMFSSIRPRDLVRQVSLNKEQKGSCRNLAHVDRMVDHFNQLASCVANYVLLRDKPKHRALMLEKFMRVARKLREMNNYNALGAVIAGIKSSSIHRLAATRELLPPAVGKDWMKLEILMAPSRSHSAYRLAWENSSSERIPYLPLHRRDLAAAEEGNKTFIGDDGDGRINWKKFEVMGDVIVSMQRAQGLPYKNLGSAKGNELIRELILDVKLVKDEEDLYERSLQCEPAASAGGAASTTARFREFFKR